MISFYEVLHVNRDASHKEIVDSYKKRVIETHPDKGGNPVEFMNVRKGYEILSDPEKRIQYDKWLSIKEAAEKIKKQHDSISDETVKMEMLKKRSYDYCIAILDKYVKHYPLYKKIRVILDSDLTIFNGIDSSLVNRKVASIAIRKIVNIIVQRKDYNIYFEELFKLEIVCYKIESGEIVIEVKSNSDNSKKDNSGTITRMQLFIIVGILIFSSLIISNISNDNEYLPRLNALRNSSSSENVSNNNTSSESSNQNSKYDDKIRNVYDALVSEGYDMSPFDEFRNNLSNKDSRKSVYNALVKEDYDMSPFEEFEANIGFGNLNTNSKRNNYPKSSSYTNAENVNQEPKYEEIKYETGDIPYYAHFGNGEYDSNSLSELTLINYSSSDAVVLLANRFHVIRNIFIKKGSEFTMREIPEGKYIVKIMFGNSWNKDKYNGDNFPKGGFMKDVSFTESKWNDAFDFIFKRDYDGIEYPSYSLTLQKVRNGNFSTNSISKDDFFN